MEITYLGKKSFKLKAKRGVAVFEDGGGVTLTGNASKTPFKINSPGEYEVEGISVFGYSGEEETVYVFQMDETRVMALGSKISDKLIDELDTIDVVMLDVECATSRELVEMIGKIEPSYILPYGESEKVAAYVKDFEHGSRETDKLSFTKATIPEDLTEVVVLK